MGLELMSSVKAPICPPRSHPVTHWALTFVGCRRIARANSDVRAASVKRASAGGVSACAARIVREHRIRASVGSDRTGRMTSKHSFMSERPRTPSTSGENHVSSSERPEDLPHSRGEDQPAQDLIVEGGAQIVWEDRWHEEEIFANRLSFYLLAQSFLVAAAVTATLSTDATSRWLPLAVTIDVLGLLLTIVFWYALTENLRRLDALKEIVAEGSGEIRIQGFREIGAVRTSHHERRAQRRLPFPLSTLLRWSPSWWLAHGIPIFFGSAWVALIAVAIVTA